MGVVWVLRPSGCRVHPFAHAIQISARMKIAYIWHWMPTRQLRAPADSVLVLRDLGMESLAVCPCPLCTRNPLRVVSCLLPYCALHGAFYRSRVSALYNIKDVLVCRP